jgi:hypothetical protein
LDRKNAETLALTLKEQIHPHQQQQQQHPRSHNFEVASKIHTRVKIDTNEI